MAIIINNKVELLRALERTEEQFNALLERNCKGELQDPVTVVTPKTGGIDGGSSGGVNKSIQPTVQGQTFSKEDKELLEAFKNINQLGLDKLREFISSLMALSRMLDQFSIQYYIQQLYNGPYAKFVREFAKFQGIFQRITDCLGIISAVSRSNSSTPVFSGVAAVVSVGVLDKSPSFIQRELNNITRTTTEVFNYNFQSSIFGDNTLPYIDKRPRVRALQELRQGFTSQRRAVANYMLKDIKTFNVMTSIAQSILAIIKAFLGADAFRLFEFKKNINPFDAQQNVSSTSNKSIPRLLMSTVQVTSETGNSELRERCIELQTGLTGNAVVNNVQVNDATLSLGESLDGSPLYTIEGRLGSGGGEPSVTPGCTDPRAENFNPNATVDDGSCEYTTEPPEPCPGGQVWNPETQECECPPGFIKNLKTGECEEDPCPVECDDTTLDY
jgi:hypothetical protein